MRLNSLLVPAAAATVASVAAQPAGQRSDPGQDQLHGDGMTPAVRPGMQPNAGRGAFMHGMERMSGILGMSGLTPFGGMDFGLVPGPVNQQPAGRAAKVFQEQFQDKALSAPGAVAVTPGELGFKPGQLVMIDIGGEGQKTYQSLKSGSAHAININAQRLISSTPLHLSLEPGDEPRLKPDPDVIPNLIQPAHDWPEPQFKGRLLPLADNFAGLTMIEGAPLFPYHVAELGRVTNKDNGWMALSVSDSFENQVAQLAENHGGVAWKFESADGGHARHILPPKSMAGRDDLKQRFEQATSHDLFDIVNQIRAGR